MTERTDPVRQPAGTESTEWVDPGMAEGWSRLLLFGGLAGLAIGHLLESGVVTWSGIAIVIGAVLLNTAGKVVHYRTLPIRPRNRVTLTATWVCLGVTVLALLVNFAHARFGPGQGSYFWPLAVAGIGFALLHMAAESSYLPAE